MFLNLVLIEIDSRQETEHLNWLPRSELQVGQTVIALGKRYHSKTPNASIGILSATNRILG